jgi:hypothetical protein
MPTPDPFHISLAKFYEREMDSPNKFAMRLQEALCAALEGQDGFDEQGRLIIDTDRMARASKAGHKIKHETDGARMLFYVVDASGKVVPTEARSIPEAVQGRRAEPDNT